MRQLEGEPGLYKSDMQKYFGIVLFLISYILLFNCQNKESKAAEQQFKDKEEWIRLFNGKDLDDWMVKINGEACETEYVSQSELHAEIAAVWVSDPGTLNLKVENPPPTRESTETVTINVE